MAYHKSTVPLQTHLKHYAFQTQTKVVASHIHTPLSYKAYKTQTKETNGAQQLKTYYTFQKHIHITRKIDTYYYNHYIPDNQCWNCHQLSEEYKVIVQIYVISISRDSTLC